MEINQNYGSLPKTQKVNKAIEQKAKEFEAVFIAESLKHAGIGMPKDKELGNNLVTSTFDSYMTRALAESIVDQGGFGMAKEISKSLISNKKP